MIRRSTNSGRTSLFEASKGDIKHMDTRARRLLTSASAPCLSFEGCEHLLRGSPLGQIMSRGGEVLSSSAGSAATYRMSQQVDGLDVFLSHNWVIGRVNKFIAVALEFNFNLAVVVTVILMVPVAVGCAFKIMPVDAPFVEAPTGTAFLARLVVGPVFMLSLLFGRDLRCMHRSGPQVFLDKTCIAQESLTEKLNGISKLGAFLVKSSRMTVLYSEVYLTKIWTVYELACFLTTHPVEDLRIVPVSQAYIFFVICTCMWLYNLSSAALRVFTHVERVNYIMLLVFLPFFVVSQRRWAKRRVEMLERLRVFDVRDCTCAVESDRPVVYGNIALLIQASLQVDSEMALDAFNVIVREQLPAALADSLGRFAFEYKHYAALGWIFAGGSLLDSFERFSDGTSGMLVVAYVVVMTAWAFAFFPVLLILVEALGASLLHLCGVWQGLWVTFTVLMTLIVAAALHFGTKAWVHASGHSVPIFIVLAFLSTCSVAAAIYIGVVYRARPVACGTEESPCSTIELVATETAPAALFPEIIREIMGEANEIRRSSV